MRLGSVRALAPDIPEAVQGYARRYADEAAFAEGSDHQVYQGYLLRKTVQGDFADVKIIDIPGKLFAVDAIPRGARGYQTAVASAGFRHPWRPEAGYTLVDDAAPEDQPIPVASFGTPTSVGHFGTQRVNTDYVGGSAGSTILASFTTRGGGANTPNGGFWRCQLEATEPLSVADFYSFGDPAQRPAHWMSVVTGYGVGQSLLDLRLSPEFVQTVAPGYYFMPPTNGGKIDGSFKGGQGGTIPMASACRRVVDGVDTLAVALPVADPASFPDIDYAYDTGTSGLLLLQFSVDGTTVALIRSHLFEVNSLHPDMQVVPRPIGTSGQFYNMNNANMQSVVITNAGDLAVFGCWLTSKWVEETSTGTNTVDGPGSVPLTHWYKAQLDATGATFNKLRTSVYVNADKDYDGWLALDDDPTSPEIAVPTDVQSMLAADGTPYGVAMCRQFERDRFVYGGGTDPLTGRNYIADPVVAYVFETNSFVSVGSIYQTTPQFVDNGTSGFQFWSYKVPWYGAAVYDTRQIMFCGFDRGPDKAKRIRFAAVDVITGAVTDDIIPSCWTGFGEYAVTPKLTTYQTKLFADEARTEVVTGVGAIVSFVPYAGGFLEGRAYAHRDSGWSQVSGVASYTGTHYLGNGFFGQCSRRFEGAGF